MARVRVEGFTISLDGYGAGPNQDVDHPLGVGGTELHQWLLPTRTFQRALFGKDGGTTGVDDDFAARGFPFHFITAGVREALDRAREAAAGMDVRIGGGPNTIRQYLREGLIDELHIAIAPVLLGRGEALFEGVDLRALGYECVESVASEKATHVVLRRQGHAEREMDSVVHFEMPYDDRARITRFYEAAFGWATQAFGGEAGDYVLATTAECDQNGSRRPGSIDGGFYPRNPEWPAQHPSVVVAVTDIAAAMKRVTDAGGRVLGDPVDIPGVGKYVSFFDTEGNRVSMLQPL